jgi:hypothetical protein
MPVPKLLVTAALMAAQVAIGMTRKIKGPRLEDLSVSLADYGTPIPRVWGTRRLNPQIIWAEPLREKKKKSKTKGGKYTEYKYFGTWAVLLCDHEIDAVTRIWFDKRLIYQRKAAGPISAAAAVLSMLTGDSNQIKLANGQNMRVYLGTEDQEPDPRIEAWCEDRYGADSCPAYRGSAYIVFEEIPLETVGNRIPQITVEVVNNSSAAYPYEQKTTEQVSLSAQFSINGNWLVYWDSEGVEMEWWDVPTRTRLGASSASDVSTLTNSTVALAADGTAYYYGWDIGVSSYLVTVPPIGTPTQTAIAGNFLFENARVLESNGNRRTLASLAVAGGISGYVDGVTPVDVDGFMARDFCVDADGEIWMLLHPEGSSNEFTLRSLTGFVSHTFTGLVTRSDPGDAQLCHVEAYGHFFVISDGKFYVIDDDTFTITSSGAIDTNVRLVPNTAHNLTAWDPVDFDEYSLEDGSLIRNLTHISWGSGAVVADGIYDPVNDAIWTREPGVGDLHIFYLNRLADSGVTLQTVVDDVSEWVGVEGHDSSALTQTVFGYSVTQGSAKDMLAPLLDIHDVDPRPHDFTVQFKVRGSAPSGSIATADLVRENGPRYTVTVQQDTDLPRRVTVNFADKDKDQQTNTVIAQRPLDAVNSNREETLDLTTYADDADGAQQKADRYFRRLWNSREQTKASLTYQKIGLEPGDVTTIELDGLSRNVRVEKAIIGLNRIDCEFVRDETSYAAVNTATTGPEMGGRDDEEIFIPGPVKGIVIDGPLASDVDNKANPIIYYLAGPMAGSFSGAVVAEGDGLDYDEVAGAVDSSQEATWGLATDVLGTANPNVWDRGNSVNINLRGGALTSVTEADINGDPRLNLAAFGVDDRWEYLNFATATLESDGSYTLSDLKRGRRGTEGNLANHAIGDLFVLLDNRVIDERGISDIGEDLSFKVQAPLRDIDAAPAIDLEYDAVCLKPYAPVHFNAYKDGGNDITFTWVRRTRLGGAWVGGSTIPLGEASESYEVDIYDGVTFKRTLASSTPTVVYSLAQQTTDFGGTATSFTANLYQMSAVVGRGSVNSRAVTF